MTVRRARREPPKRLSVSFPPGTYRRLKALAEGQRPPLSLQYVVALAVERFLDGPSTAPRLLPDPAPKDAQ